MKNKLEMKKANDGNTKERNMEKYDTRDNTRNNNKMW